MKMKFAALDLMLMFGCLLALPAQAQTACSNASLSGMYFYLVSGPYAITTTGSSPYAELGKFVADGNGGLSGQSVASQNGSITPYTFTGSYEVAGDCTGALTLTFAGTPSPRAYPISIVDERNDRRPHLRGSQTRGKSVRKCLTVRHLRLSAFGRVV